MESKEVIEKLHRAESNLNTKAIIIRINSPGGAVGPTQEIYEEMLRIDSSIPVYASFGTIAASGGYYIAAAAREIYANAGTLTGSIGVIMEFMNLEELYKFAKLKPNTIKSGKYKDIGHPSRKMSAEEKDLMEKMISGVHKQFISDILMRRKDKIKGDINEHAQGQVFSGEEAFKLGLVDKIGSLWKLGRDIHSELKLPGDFKLDFVKKKKKLSILDIVENLEEVSSNLNFFSKFKDSPFLMFR